jgi:hypothetical protein
LEGRIQNYEKLLHRHVLFVDHHQIKSAFGAVQNATTNNLEFFLAMNKAGAAV